VKKVLIGCGIVLGVLFLISVGTTIVLVSWVKREMPDLQHVEDTRRELVELHGPRERYKPDPEAQLVSERIDVFLAVRESLLATRSEIAGRTESFIERTRAERWEGRGVFQNIVEGLSMAKGGVGLFSQGMEYIGARANHLLDAGMGEGEYVWLYCLMTFSWLEWDPYAELGEEWFNAHEMSDVPEQFREEYRRIFMRQLRNQRSALEEIEARSNVEEEALQRVHEALRLAWADRDLFPYEGNLPPGWVDVLEPFRERFIATLPRTPGAYLLDSVEQLIDEDQRGGVRIEVSGDRPRQEEEGTTVCEEWERFGSEKSGYTQRCEYKISNGRGRYSLELTGDYGEEVLPVAVTLLSELEGLDTEQSTGAEEIAVSFPDQGEWTGEWNFTVPMSSLRECSERLGESKRQCIISLITNALKQRAQ
jgi:hypothetical protein